MAQRCVMKEEQPESSSPLPSLELTSSLTVSQKTAPSHKNHTTALDTPPQKRKTAEATNLNLEVYEFSPATEEPTHHQIDMKMKDEPVKAGDGVIRLPLQENVFHKNDISEGVRKDDAVGNSGALMTSLVGSEDPKPMSSGDVLYVKNSTEGKSRKNSMVYTNGTDSGEFVLSGGQLTLVDSALPRLANTAKTATSTSEPFSAFLQASRGTAQNSKYILASTDNILLKERIKAAVPATPSATVSPSKKMTSDNVMDSNVVDNFDEGDNLVVRSREMTNSLLNETEDTFESDITGTPILVNLTPSSFDNGANESPAVNTEKATLNNQKMDGNSDIPASPVDITPVQDTTAPIHIHPTESTGTTTSTSTTPASTSTTVSKSTTQTSTTTTVSTSSTQTSATTTVSTSTSPTSTPTKVSVSSSTTSTSATTLSETNSLTTDSKLTAQADISSSVMGITVPQNTPESTNSQQKTHSLDKSDAQTSEATTSSTFSTQNLNYSTNQTNKLTSTESPRLKYSTAPSTAATSPRTSKSTLSEMTVKITSTRPPPVLTSFTVEVATKGNNSGLALNPDSDTSEDDTFWPIVVALVIGIPSIIVFGIAIVVIHRRRRVASPRLRVASMYPSL